MGSKFTQIGLWICLMIACSPDSPLNPLAPTREIALSECDSLPPPPPPPPSGIDSFPVPVMDGGGLYGGGANSPPQFHSDAGLIAASQVPVSGAVMISLGQSITRMPFAEWQRTAVTDAVMVNGACGGCTVQYWLPGATNQFGRKGWVNAFDSLSSRGLTRDDVDVVWMSVTREQWKASTTAELEAIFAQIKDAYPNVRQVFVTNRTYGGWRTKGSAEPEAWSEGLAVRQFVLNHLGETDPWLGWSGDIWANGDVQRSDGLTWTRADFKDDGLHYSPVIGTQKVGALVRRQFEESPFTAWYQP